MEERVGEEAPNLPAHNPNLDFRPNKRLSKREFWNALPNHLSERD
jgi:hypothetical protein